MKAWKRLPLGISSMGSRCVDLRRMEQVDEDGEEVVIAAREGHCERGERQEGDAHEGGDHQPHGRPSVGHHDHDQRSEQELAHNLHHLPKEELDLVLLPQETGGVGRLGHPLRLDGDPVTPEQGAVRAHNQQPDHDEHPRHGQVDALAVVGQLLAVPLEGQHLERREAVHALVGLQVVGPPSARRQLPAPRVKVDRLVRVAVLLAGVVRSAIAGPELPPGLEAPPRDQLLGERRGALRLPLLDLPGQKAVVHVRRALEDLEERAHHRRHA
eukprot:scaffold13341_cov101-Isochrysis_galbana.AAC.3